MWNVGGNVYTGERPRKKPGKKILVRPRRVPGRPVVLEVVRRDHKKEGADLQRTGEGGKKKSGKENDKKCRRRAARPQEGDASMWSSRRTRTREGALHEDEGKCPKPTHGTETSLLGEWRMVKRKAPRKNVCKKGRNHSGKMAEPRERKEPRRPSSDLLQGEIDKKMGPLI